MVREGFTNLSIEAKRADNVRKDWEQHSDSEESFSRWVISVLESAITREINIKKKFPHLKVLKLLPNGLVIDNSKTNDIIKVIKTGTKIDCSSKTGSSEYIEFALSHPQFPY